MRTLIVAAAVALLCIGVAAAGTASAPVAADPGGKPNIVVVMTDDQRLDDLYASFGDDAEPIMPHTLELIADQGVTFERSYVSYPLSCPSRTTFLTGEYAHNHRIVANILKAVPGERYCGEPSIFPINDSLGPWLDRAGYQTILAGRYLNAYPGAGNPRTGVDPGWDRWLVPVTVSEAHQAAQFYDYILNRDGSLDPVRASAPEDYFTDVIVNEAIDAIDKTPEDRPFFLFLSHRAPHEDIPIIPDGPEPAPRHLEEVDEIYSPHHPNYDEEDVSDKPHYVRLQPRLDKKERRRATIRAQRRRASLRSVDDGVLALRDALEADGRLDNTYFIFTSDNGFGLGEHRFPKGKTRPYEETTRVPLLIAGPGIPAGETSDELVSNIDLAPTILQLAKANATESMDGRSLLPFAWEPGRLSNRPLLIHAYRNQPQQGLAAPTEGNPRVLADDYQGIILGRYKLVRYLVGDRELYDLELDPYELENRFDDPAYAAVRNYLAQQLARLERCRGDECREEVPKPPLPAGE